MSRILKLIPNLFTLCNLGSGVIGLVFIVSGIAMAAFFFILLSAIFDFFDGKVARKLKVTGEFGAELDSLADVVSFGVVPALAVFNVAPPTFIAKLALVLFPMAGALRLARFNLNPTVGYFEGLPIPAAGIGAGVLLWIPALYPYAPWIVLVLAFLMVSKIRVPKI